MWLHIDANKLNDNQIEKKTHIPSVVSQLDKTIAEYSGALGDMYQSVTVTCLINCQSTCNEAIIIYRG